MRDRAQIISIHVGRVRTHAETPGRPWRSAIQKEAVPGPVFLGHLGLVGDEVGDPRHHGGPNQAVLAYPSEHYPLWRAELGLEGGPGGFGENLSLAGLSEEDVCIGDVFDLGGARLQVSHPRQPCHTLARRWARPELVNAVWENGRGGWYCRVLQEGDVSAGQAMVRVDRPHPGWTVARVLWAFRDAGRRPDEALAAAALEHLTPSWKEKLAERAREVR